ncbi:hypothetical protein H632_c2037p0, partial [Helicosporidium sp. ATCC 50920]
LRSIRRLREFELWDGNNWDRSDYVALVQWAPAAPGDFRALNFDVFLPNIALAQFSDAMRASYISTVAGSVVTIGGVATNGEGILVNTIVEFGTNPNTDWLAPARQLYLVLRTGAFDTVLAVDTWGPSFIHGVTMPYLTGDLSDYQPASIVYGLQVNLHLLDHDFDWLTLVRANELLAPLRAMSGMS